MWHALVVLFLALFGLFAFGPGDGRLEFHFVF